MKDNILNINLETSTAPVVKETRGREWISYGAEDWANLYPQFIIDLYYNSSTQAAIINATSEMIAGEDLIIEDEDEKNLEARVKLQHFMDRANSNESLHEVLKKVAFDFKLQGAFALNVVWSKDRTQIAEIYHVPVEKIRAERPDEMGKVHAYYVSADWANTRMNKPHRVPAFNTNDRTAANQILYTGLYSPNMNVYHTPDYVAANNWALVDQKVAEFHLNNIQNGFAGSYFISFANGVPTAEERYQIEQSLSEKFTGAKSAGRFVLTFSDDRTRTPEITPISMSDADKQYLALQELLVQNILTGHRVTSPMLMGIKSDTGLGNNADELNTAANFYLNTVVKPFQDQIVKTLRKIFKVNNMDLPVNFVQLKPITTRFTNQDLAAVMTQDEIREELGLAPLDTDVEVKENLAEIGNIDGQPVFSSIEEAEAYAKQIGCKGYHTHEYEGKTAYMACTGHAEATSLSKIELQEWIDSVGEEMDEEWEMVDEEIVDGEHNDFDFEAELNKQVEGKTELASTPTARPNARSTQDGVNKSYNDYYKVRYVYATDNFLVNKSGTSRDFCRLMVGANKVFRKEDLVNANSQVVNKGFGHPETAHLDNKDGSPINGTYNIFLYKGGPQCRHFFLRRIYKSSLRNAKKPIVDAEVIGYTKAVSEGFTAERNNKLVAIAPQRMKNNGYYN
tara:strand:+ start:2484 stop:4520 length:2037 start_codon:yes stop_codon:yes gene_type:complete